MASGFLASTSAWAESIHPRLDDPFTLQVGVFLQDADAEVTAQRDPLPKTGVTIEDLGLDDARGVLLLGIRWRFSERLSFGASYNRYNESGRVENGTTFNFDGKIYPAGARLDSSLQADAYIFDLSYSLYKDERSEFGIGIGIHAFDFEASIAGEYAIGDDTDQFTEEEVDLLAPLPNLRAYGIYALSPKWTVGFGTGWLDVTMDDYRGRLLYLQARTEYRISESWGVGVGYQLTDVDVSKDRSNGKDKYEVDFEGALVYLTYNW